MTGRRGKRAIIYSPPLEESSGWKRQEGKKSQVCGVTGKPRVLAVSLCLGGDSVVWRRIPTALSRVGNRTGFVPSPKSHVPPFSRPKVHTAGLSRQASCQWVLMSSPGRAALVKCYGLEWSFTGWKSELIQLRSGVPGFEPATISILWEHEKLIICRVWVKSTLKISFPKESFPLQLPCGKSGQVEPGSSRSRVFSWGSWVPRLPVYLVLYST